MVNPVGLQDQSNSLVNQADISGLPSRIVQAIKTAAAHTGVDFSYLMNKASQESGFDPNAKASTSSATGLFQFTNQTWLTMVKNHGADYGLSNYADHISIDSYGVAHVSDPTWRQAILGLRKDPQISAEMAGELDKQNLSSLKDTVGGKIGATELYLAHFLGAGGASDFINEMRSNPNAKAADVLPDAASANSSVFYDSDGNARSLKQIYQHFAQKFDGSSNATMVASTQSSSRSHRTYTAPSYAIADASASTTPTSHYMPSVMSNIKAGSNSLMATMILAQMNVGDMSDYGAANATNHAHKTAIDILGSVG